MANTIQYLGSALTESQGEIEKVRSEWKADLEGLKQQVGQGMNTLQNQAWTGAVLGKEVAKYAREHPDRDIEKVWNHMVEKRVPWDQAEAEIYGEDNQQAMIQAAAQKIIEEQGYVKPGETPEPGQPGSPEGLGESFGQRTWHRPNKPGGTEVLVGEDAFVAKVNERLEKEFGAVQ